MYISMKCISKIVSPSKIFFFLIYPIFEFGGSSALLKSESSDSHSLWLSYSTSPLARDIVSLSESLIISILFEIKKELCCQGNELSNDSCQNRGRFTFCIFDISRSISLNNRQNNC